MKNRRGNIVVIKFLLVGMRWMFIVDICKGFFLLHVWLIHSFKMINFKLFWQQFVLFTSTFTSCLVHELTTVQFGEASLRYEIGLLHYSDMVLVRTEIHYPCLCPLYSMYQIEPKDRSFRTGSKFPSERFK